ncbi:MAG: biotin/lipoyl-binding protein [Planctomycetota bacterium]|nr:biotin/lipoyl-binding protein [Planctomycetota bacterium]
MTKYFVTVEGEEYAVHVEGDSVLLEKLGEDGEVLSSKQVDATLAPVHGRQSTLNIGTEKQVVAIQEIDRHHLQVLFPGLPGLSCEVYDEISRALGGEVKQQGELFVKSPMPGIVLSIAVTEGQELSEGDPLLILEAMKTENEITAGLDARVKKIHVSPGDTIQNASLLVELEEL